MSEHPGPERLSDYVYGLVSESDSAAIEAHLSGCKDCGWLAQRYVIEMRRLGEAVSADVPAGLSNRILARATPRRVRLLPFAAAAAVLVSLASAYMAHREKNEALSRLRDAEQPRTEKVNIPNVLDELCRVEVERNVAEIVAWAELRSEREAPLRTALLAATATTAEVFDRASRGEIDMDQLLGTDTLAGLDAELKSILEPSEYEAVSSWLKESSRDAAERVIRGFLRDLQAASGISDGQRSALEALLLEGSAWRRDLSFLPDFVRRHLCVHLLRRREALRGEIAGRLHPEQAQRAMAFLQREEAAHRKMWERLREKS